MTNVSVSLKLRPSIHTNAYLVFLSKAAGAAISQVTISMAETDAFVIDGPDTSFVDNINGAGTAVYTSCLYGGYETDAEYVAEAAGQGFTVVGSAEEFITIK